MSLSRPVLQTFLWLNLVVCALAVKRHHLRSYTDDVIVSGYSEVAAAPYFLSPGHRNITTSRGQTAYLHCRVASLGDKATKRNSEEQSVLEEDFDRFRGAFVLSPSKSLRGVISELQLPKPQFATSYTNVKNVVHVLQLLANLEKLKTSISEAVGVFTPNMHQRVLSELNFCIDVCRCTIGEHTECHQYSPIPQET
ncbi:hypothetical protein FHG87_001436 [Trinorchestia longiramus]|nr:hypothetical protein FHG87_001436 [Trinorchestia longiramus]